MDYPCDLIRVANGMRGRDEETGEFLGASRSQQRRDALDVLELAQRLVALPPAQLAKLPVPEDLHPHIADTRRIRSEEHTSELQSLMRISYAVFCLKKKTTY